MLPDVAAWLLVRECALNMAFLIPFLYIPNAFHGQFMYEACLRGVDGKHILLQASAGTLDCEECFGFNHPVFSQ